MADPTARRADGTPKEWLGASATTVHHPMRDDGGAGAGQQGQPTFDRKRIDEDQKNDRLSSQYMPAPFVPELPKLESEPALRIYRDPPITTIDRFSMSDIRSALDAHMIGNFFQSAQLSDAMTGDDRVASVLGTRVKGLLGLPFNVRVRTKRKGDDKAHDVAKFIKRAWKRMVPRAQAAMFLQWGIMMGFALAEIVWRYRGGFWMPTIRTWHPQLTYYRYDTRAFYAVTLDGPVRVVPGDGKWILYAPHGDYRGWIHGSVRTCAVPWRYRGFGWRDWARHCEKHGKPWVKLITPLNSNDADKNRFFNSFLAMGDETTIQTPVVDQDNRFDVELMEAQHPAAEVFAKFVERCDTLISCAMLGQNLTTEVQGGSYAAATVHGQIRQDFLEADAYTLGECLQQQIVRPFCAYNFPDGQKYVPSVGWDATPPDDKKMTAETLKNFAGSIYQLAQAHFPIDVLALAAQFGVPLWDGAPNKLPKIDPPKAPFEGHNVFDMGAMREMREAVDLLRAAARITGQIT